MWPTYFHPMVYLAVIFNLYSLVNRCVGLLAHGSLPMKRCSINKPLRTLSKVEGRGRGRGKRSTTCLGSNSWSVLQVGDRKEIQNVQRLVGWCALACYRNWNENIKRTSFSTGSVEYSAALIFEKQLFALLISLRNPFCRIWLLLCSLVKN